MTTTTTTAPAYDWGKIIQLAAKPTNQQGNRSNSLLATVLAAQANNNIDQAYEAFSNPKLNAKYTLNNPTYGGTTNGRALSRNYVDPYSILDMYKNSGNKNDYEMFQEWNTPDKVNSLIPTLTGDQYLSTEGSKITDMLNAGLARGQYTPTGFAAGMAKYNELLNAAKPKANDLALGVLQGGRQSLYDILNEAQSSYLQNSKAFDFDPYIPRLEAAAKEFNAGAADKIKNAITGASFFDFNKIATGVGQGQGAYNAPNNDLLKALLAQRERQSNTRNLQNQGSF